MARIKSQKSFTRPNFLKKNLGGFTLVELLVTVAIFSLIVSAASGVFVSALKAQRRSLATQELLDQTSFLMEYMSRAIRMAKKDDLAGVNCLSGNKINYELTRSGLGIKFRNYKDECQEFYLDGNQLKEAKAGSLYALTSNHLRVSKFNINLSGQTQTDDLQPRVTLFLEIEGKEKSKIRLQTTISQRNLDIEI